jgi:hypothetical protein
LLLMTPLLLRLLLVLAMRARRGSRLRRAFSLELSALVSPN